MRGSDRRASARVFVPRPLRLHLRSEGPLDRKLKPLPPDLYRRQKLAIARTGGHIERVDLSVLLWTAIGSRVSIPLFGRQSAVLP